MLAYQKYQLFQKTILKMLVVGGPTGALYPGMYM
jgi:hypothetical protein